MQGFAVVLVLILLPLSGLVIATRRQPVTVGSVSIKRKGRAMTQGETLTIGRASLDAVIRERDNAVERAANFAQDAGEVRGAIRDRDILIEKLRKDNKQLREDNQRIGTIAAQFAGAKDVTKLTTIDRDRLARLEVLEERARGIIGELVEAVDEPGYVEVDNGCYRDEE